MKESVKNREKRNEGIRKKEVRHGTKEVMVKLEEYEMIIFRGSMNCLRKVLRK